MRKKNIAVCYKNAPVYIAKISPYVHLGAIRPLLNNSEKQEVMIQEKRCTTYSDRVVT